MEQTKIEDLKQDLINWISAQKNDVVLRQMGDIKKYHEKDFWDDLSDAEKESIRMGQEDVEKGNTVLHSEAKKCYEKWL
jgi:gas vesicle protein